MASNGDVNPSGFLPLKLGNVRSERLSTIYRESSLLRDIRAAAFTGVCGSCDFAELCGGSRSRAFAVTNDPLGDDPGCVKVAAAALVVARAATGSHSGRPEQGAPPLAGRARVLDCSMRLPGAPRLS